MSVHPPDPVRDTAAVREETGRLLDAVAALSPSAVAEPSRLPGWTRGHLLTHLARSADGLVNLATWARTGEERPAYPDERTREQDIEAGAGRPLDELLADLRASAERLDAALSAMPPRGWAAQVRARGQEIVPAAVIPARRLQELHLHHVDLDIGYTCADIPADFAARELALLLDRWAGREGIAAIRVQDTDTGADWRLGAAEQPESTVRGGTGALLAWASGRGDGTGLTVRPDLPLPTLPPLG